MSNFYKNSKTKAAFSLIELSIVILIIGIIIAAITSSSILLSKSRLQAARTLTKNSPAAAIKDMVLWLEPTLDASFLAAETENGAQLTKWNDTNPQTSQKRPSSRTASAAVTYDETAINNIPGVYFNGTTGFASLAGDVIPLSGNQFTLFMVVQATNPTAADTRAAFCDGGGSTGFCYIKHSSPSNGSRLAYAYNNNNTSSTSVQSDQAEIIIMNCCNTTMQMSVNGTAQTISSPSSSIVTPTGQFFIGNSHASGQDEPWYGFISEVILYERVLKSTEITEIKRYLSKKYNIAVN